MTIIRVDHGKCPASDLRASEVVLNISTRRPALSHYAFTCAACGERVTKPVDGYLIDLLTSGGAVPRTRWEPPLEALEPRPGGATIGYDDVIELCLQMGANDDLARWAA